MRQNMTYSAYSAYMGVTFRSATGDRMYASMHCHVVVGADKERDAYDADAKSLCKWYGDPNKRGKSKEICPS